MRAGVIIFSENFQKLLLIHRWKKGREYYVIPGGTVEAGETALEAAIREIQEELRIDFTPEELIPALVYGQGPDQQTYFFAFYSGTEKLEISGEEKARSHAQNRYEPCWVSCEQVNTIPLQPQDLKEEIIQKVHVIKNT